MLHVAEQWRPVFDSLGLTSCEAAARYFLGEQAGGDGARVAHREVPCGDGARDVFFKQYSYSPASWKFIGRASKALREARNYRELGRLGMAVPEVVCHGESRDALGRLRRAVIATVAVPGAITLPEYLARGAESRTRRHLLLGLAESVRRLHAAAFHHHDLVGRNLLVNFEAGEPCLWWIDCPRGAYDRWSPARHRKRLRDLAGLDKTGAQFCSRSERMRWLLAYLGCERAGADAKRLAREVTRYRLEH